MFDTLTAATTGKESTKPEDSSEMDFAHKGKLNAFSWKIEGEPRVLIRVTN